MTRPNKKKALVFLGEKITRFDCTKNAYERALIDRTIKVLEKQNLNTELKKIVRLSKAIRKICTESNISKVRGIFKKCHSNKQRIILLKSMIEKTQWDKNPSQRSLIDQEITKLSQKTLHSKVKKELKYVKHIDMGIKTYKAAKEQGSLASKTFNPVLSTVKISDKNTLKHIGQILNVWEEKARLKKDIASSVVTNLQQTEKKDLTSGSLRIIQFLQSILSSGSLDEDEAVYIAYDANKKVHGVALADFSRKKKPEIEYICSHPDNLEVLGNEQNIVRGAGSGIITHIANDIWRKKEFKNKKITLTSLPSAVPFYKKLGFTGKRSDMMLKDDRMKALLQKKSATHIQKQAPSARWLYK